MNANHQDIPWLDKKHFENRENYSADELMKYAGQYVAWNWDGDTILDSAPDHEALWERLKARGIDTNRVVYEYIDDL